MNGETIYQGLAGVDPALVEDAAPGMRKAPWYKKAWLHQALAAAACVLLLSLGSYQLLYKTVSVIYVTINPNVSIELNRLGYVRSLRGLNQDGILLLEGYDHTGKTRTQVAEELIERAQEQGYLTEGGQVTISIESASAKEAEKYDSEFAQIAAGAYAQQAGVQLSVRDILTAEQVKSLVLEHFGLTDATFYELECELEHERAYYECELVSGGVRYECELDAVQGTILEAEAKGQSTAAAAEAVQDGTATAAPTPGSCPTVQACLTPAQAQSIALERAGLSEAVFEKTELDHDHDRQIYELEFWANGWEYECELDAGTGEILKFEQDGSDDHHGEWHHGHS